MNFRAIVVVLQSLNDGWPFRWMSVVVFVVAFVGVLATVSWLYSDNALVTTITDAVIADSNCCLQLLLALLLLLSFTYA